jgi:hypothetical protein
MTVLKLAILFAGVASGLAGCGGSTSDGTHKVIVDTADAVRAYSPGSNVYFAEWARSLRSTFYRTHISDEIM